MNRKQIILVLLIFVIINSFIIYMYNGTEFKSNLRLNKKTNLTSIVKYFLNSEIREIHDENMVGNVFDKNHYKIIGLFNLNSCPACILEKISILNEFNKYFANKVSVASIFFHDNKRELKLFKTNEEILFPVYMAPTSFFEDKVEVDESEFPIILVYDQDNNLMSSTTILVENDKIEDYKKWVKSEIDID